MFLTQLKMEVLSDLAQLILEEALYSIVEL